MKPGVAPGGRRASGLESLFLQWIRSPDAALPMVAQVGTWDFKVDSHGSVQVGCIHCLGDSAYAYWPQIMSLTLKAITIWLRMAWAQQ